MSESLKKNLVSWANDPESFLEPERSTDISSTKISSILNCSITTIYQELLEIETRNSGDIIRMRFLKVLFHHMRDRICVSYLRPDAVEWMARKVVAGLDNCDNSKISAKIKDWTSVGARYDALCRDIGTCNIDQDFSYLGNLFRLPDKFTDRQ